MGHVPRPGYVKLPLWSLNKIQSNPIQDAHFTGPTCLVSKGLEVIASLSSIILLVEMGSSWTHRVEKICNKPKLPELFQGKIAGKLCFSLWKTKNRFPLKKCFPIFLVHLIRTTWHISTNVCEKHWPAVWHHSPYRTHPLFGGPHPSRVAHVCPACRDRHAQTSWPCRGATKGSPVCCLPKKQFKIWICADFARWSIFFRFKHHWTYWTSSKKIGL